MDTNTEKKNSKARQVYSHAIADAKKDKRRQQAEDRQFKYDGLTLNQKLARAKARVAEGFGNCAREIARLEKQLKDAEWQKAQKVTAAKQAPMTDEQKAVKAVKRSKDAALAAAR